MDKYGLIGYPLGHSFSVSYFNEKFENENIDACYINFEIPTIDNLREVLDKNPELRGLNVTIPYKQQVIPYLDAVSPEARAIGAVNVIRIRRKGKNIHLKGFNSDVIGFTQSIEPLLEPCHKKALILGTGGASDSKRPSSVGRGATGHFSMRILRPKSSANTRWLSIARRSECIRTSIVVRICPTRRWTATRCSTTCSTTPTKRCL